MGLFPHHAEKKCGGWLESNRREWEVWCRDYLAISGRESGVARTAARWGNEVNCECGIEGGQPPSPPFAHPPGPEGAASSFPQTKDPGFEVLEKISENSIYSFAAPSAPSRAACGCNSIPTARFKGQHPLTVVESGLPAGVNIQKVHGIQSLWRQILGVLLTGWLTTSASGAVVVSIFENHDASGAGPAFNPGIPLSVSNSDLVNAGQLTLSGFSSAGFTPFTGGGTSSPSVLNDGQNGGWNLTAGNTAVTTQSAAWSLTYALNTSEAAFGYDISGIDVMSLWTNDYVNQRYSVEVATVSEPAFAALFGPVVATTSTTNGPNIGSSLMSSIREDFTNVLASGVTAVRFNFETQPSPAGQPHHAAYREVDIYGVASVPEPATVSFLLLGAGLAAVRRRRAGPTKKAGARSQPISS